MVQFGVTPAELAAATQWDPAEVQRRYDGAVGSATIAGSNRPGMPPADPFLAAYYASDYARLNSLIAGAGVTGAMAASRYSLSAADIERMQADGIKFSAPAAGVSPLVLVAAAAALLFLG